MRAEVAVCTEWSNEKSDWPAKKRFLLNMISRKKRVSVAQNERHRT